MIVCNRGDVQFIEKHIPNELYLSVIRDNLAMVMHREAIKSKALVEVAVLWDIRVDDSYKHQGIGQVLLDIAVKWSREQGLVQMKIECQNNNIPAVKFYHKQGAVLSAIDEYAYYKEPEYRHEAPFIWFLDL